MQKGAVLAKDSTLFTELPKQHKSNDDADFRDDLSHYTSDCPQMAGAIKLVRYNKSGYKKLMNQYEKCIKKPFPFFKFGITAGYSWAKPVAKTDVLIACKLEYRYDGGFMAGLFLDSPILLSDFSFFIELLYTQHEFSSNKIIRDKKFDFYGKMSSVQVPVLFRYSFPSNYIRPFVFAGVVFSYNFNVEDYINQTTIVQNGIEITGIIRTSLISQTTIGYSIGGGTAVQLFPKNWVSFEIRYNGHYTMNNDQSMLDFNEFQLTTGISF